MCELGTTIPAFEGTFGAVFPSDRVLAAGDRVVLDAGVLVDGYEGGLARTIVCGEPTPAASPADDMFDGSRRGHRAGRDGRRPVGGVGRDGGRPPDARRSRSVSGSASSHRSSATTRPRSSRG